MAIDIKIDGKPRWDASDYSVAEDSTPLDPADTGGAVGQFTISLPVGEGSKYARGRVVDLADGTRGKTQGIADSVSGDQLSTTIVVNSRLIALNVVRTAQPYRGTLNGAFTYYFGLCGITENIVFSPDMPTVNVVFGGWTQNVWLNVKALCASYRVELSFASNNIVVRPLRQRTAQMGRVASKTWNIDNSNHAQSVEGYWYEPSEQSSGLLYPVGGWSTDTEILQVNAGETVTADLSLTPGDDGEGLGVSATSVTQPVCVDSVGRYDSASSVYTVSGNDGLPIKAAAWRAMGGALSVKIGDDTRSLIVTVTAPQEAKYAPYQIAMSAGTSSAYSSLRIVGTGVFFNRQKLVFSTGVSADDASTEVGATVDLPFITSRDQLVKLMVRTVGAYSAGSRTISINATGINHKGDVGAYSYGKVPDWNAFYAGKTAADFNTTWAGKTAHDWDVWWTSRSAENFENQAFGNVAGARVYDDFAYYRIRSVGALTPSAINFTAEMDVTAADFQETWAGKTAADFDAAWTGLKARDFNTRPLMIPTPEYQGFALTVGGDYVPMVMAPPESVSYFGGGDEYLNVETGGQLADSTTAGYLTAT